MIAVLGRVKSLLGRSIEATTSSRINAIVRIRSIGVLILAATLSVGVVGGDGQVLWILDALTHLLVSQWRARCKVAIRLLLQL